MVNVNQNAAGQNGIDLNAIDLKAAGQNGITPKDKYRLWCFTPVTVGDVTSTARQTDFTPVVIPLAPGCVDQNGNSIEPCVCGAVNEARQDCDCDLPADQKNSFGRREVPQGNCNYR